MASQKEGLGVFGAFAVVLVVMGLLALLAHFLGVLPQY